MTIKYQPEKFKDMPEPESILTMCWEDVYSSFVDKGIEPTKDMIEEAFSFAVNNADNECIMDAFWENIKYAVDENSNVEDKE